MAVGGVPRAVRESLTTPWVGRGCGATLPARPSRAALGVLCCSNMYFGLQTGWITMGSLQASLIGYTDGWGLVAVAGHVHRLVQILSLRFVFAFVVKDDVCNGHSDIQCRIGCVPLGQVAKCVCPIIIFDFFRFALRCRRTFLNFVLAASPPFL